MDEVDKIKERYARRKEMVATPTRGYECFVRHSTNEKQKKYTEILERHFSADFSGIKMMEVGAGTGQNISFFIEQGFKAGNIWANELLEDRYQLLRERFPDIHTDHGNAAELPYEDYFDLVFQSTVFTSILDDGLKKKLAATMFTMLKPGGLLLWYDFTFDNPRNKHVRWISKREVRKLFPGASDIRFQRVTLAPPIGKRVFGMYNFINFVFPFLRTHVIAEIYK